MKSMDEITWGQITRFRVECRQRFGEIHQLPCGSFSTLVKKLIPPAGNILDIGAGVEKPLTKYLSQPGQHYFSLDSDTSASFDFRDFPSIPDGLIFDIAFANQVLEHVTVDGAFQIAQSAYQVLKDGGLFIVTVPNAAHPVRQWGDATHLTAWPLGDLYGLLRLAGYEVISISRYSKYSPTRNPFKRLIIQTIAQAYRIDWCESLFVLAVKQPSI